MNSNDEQVNVTLGNGQVAAVSAQCAYNGYCPASGCDNDERGCPPQRTAEQDRQWNETAGCITRGTYSPEREAQARADLIAALPPGNLKPGDPVPPERTGGMTGFVAGECGHRLAGSEWRAGFRSCERCQMAGAESVFRLADAASRTLGGE